MAAPHDEESVKTISQDAVGVEENLLDKASSSEASQWVPYGVKRTWPSTFNISLLDLDAKLRSALESGSSLSSKQEHALVNHLYEQITAYTL